MRNSEGFTALHYASFNGNKKAIDLLVQSGADIHAKSKQGLGMMHLAAQNDMAYALTYFYKQGVSVNERDNEQSTALHWAAFRQQATSMYYLLGWRPDINARDAKGNTPLHIAAEFADKWGDLRPIKELLMKGADRNAVNNKGERPIDVMELNVQDEEIKAEMRMLLVNFDRVTEYRHFRSGSTAQAC